MDASHVLIPFVASNIVLIINKIDKTIKITLEKPNARRAH